MGGLGSGRPRRRADVTELLRVTLADLKPFLRGRDGRVRLVVNEARVECVAVPHAFGGVRWWLLCPLCQHRRAALYGRKVTIVHERRTDGPESVTRHLWGCRVCFRLGYPSQRLEPYFLLRDRLRLVWHRLGGTDETFDDFSVWRWPKRPKGMRRATQARLKDEYNGLVEQSEAEGWAALRRFAARYGG